MENTLTTEINFRPYSSNDRESCLSIFDANCPKYFATNERSDYAQFLGIGSIFMNRAISLANNLAINHIKIAASHLSAPFFTKYGAVKVLEIKNGWGPDMHRIDMELMVND